MQLPEYDEYERIEPDHDEAHVLDMMERAQADEHWGLEQEQALLRDIGRIAALGLKRSPSSSRKGNHSRFRVGLTKRSGRTRTGRTAPSQS